MNIADMNSGLVGPEQQFLHHPNFGGFNFPNTLPPTSFGSTGLPDSPLRRSIRPNYQVSNHPGQMNSQLPSSMPGHPNSQAQSLSLSNSQQTSQSLPLTLNTESDPALIVQTMANPESGLDVRERVWLKIKIPYAFIGTDAIKWLHTCVQGFKDKKSARKFAAKLLKDGLIESAVSPSKNFSKNCYYVFSNEILAKSQLPITNDPNYREFQNPPQLLPPNGQIPPSSGPGNVLNDLRQPNFNPITNGFNGQTKPGSNVVRFIRNWDETSEFHNYGYFGPDCGDEGSRVSGKIYFISLYLSLFFNIFFLLISRRTQS